jgi:hypothetical protein
VPIRSAPSARPSAEAVVEPSAAEAPQVFTGRAAAAPAGVGGDVQTFLLGAGVGALLTVFGVAIGYLLGRRR